MIDQKALGSFMLQSWMQSYNTALNALIIKLDNPNNCEDMSKRARQHADMAVAEWVSYMKSITVEGEEKLVWLEAKPFVHIN